MTTAAMTTAAPAAEQICEPPTWFELNETHPVIAAGIFDLPRKVYRHRGLRQQGRNHRIQSQAGRCRR